MFCMIIKTKCKTCLEKFVCWKKCAIEQKKKVISYMRRAQKWKCKMKKLEK